MDRRGSRLVHPTRTEERPPSPFKTKAQAPHIYTESIEEACKVVSGGLNCDKKITLPVSAETKYCPQKSAEWVPCKTKNHYSYPCGTLSNPFKKCDGWTCIPGTKETWVNVPCGFNIKTKSVGICDAIQSNLQINPNVLKTSSVMCECIPKALKLEETGALFKVEANSAVNSGTSELLERFVQLQKCFLDNSFKIQDERNELMTSGDLSPQKGTFYIKAAEIDLAKYIKFAEGIALCVFGSCDAIGNFFLDYLRESQRSMSHQLKTIYQPWTSTFRDMVKNLKHFETSFDAISRSNKEVEDEIRSLGSAACKDASGCAKDTLRRFNDEVSRTLQLQLDIAKGRQDIQQAVSLISKMSNLIEQVERTMSKPPTIEGLVQLVIAGKIKKVSDIVEVLNLPNDFRRLIQGLQKHISTIQKFISDQERQARIVSRNIASITSGSWTHETNITDDDVIKKISSIQSKFKDQILPTVTDIIGSVSTTKELISSLPSNSRSFNVEPPKVASYTRWSPVSMNMPCSKWDTYMGTFGYPKFYNCHYEQTIHWPNHHIPYIKVQVR
ncbi:hypothetical protein N7486_001262 [Penicillium sp. IBT 16267x]|nr:hypothetical protein N7486_001262 [Penicillium sp. IBT 16267x]